MLKINWLRAAINIKKTSVSFLCIMAIMAIVILTGCGNRIAYKSNSDEIGSFHLDR